MGKDRRKLRISQCMIVKDEEENIERALSWGKGLVWEQIVVDTGSSDKTVELAQTMGAKVFHFDWIDDFAAAKNYALEQAGGDWIAFLDADEYMEPEAVEKLPGILKEAHRRGLSFICSPCLQLGDSEEVEQASTQYRFFKNAPKIRYEQSVHEYLTYNGSGVEKYTLETDELPIFHTGYTTKEMKKKKKSERNTRILLKELERNPRNKDIMGYLGDSCKSGDGSGGDAEAEEWYRKALPLIWESGGKNQRDIYTAVRLMLILYRRGAEDELMGLYRQATAHFTDVPDFDYLAGRFYTEHRDYRKGTHYLERAFAIMESYGAGAFSPVMSADVCGALHALAVCYYGAGELGKCVNACVTTVKMDKEQTDCLGLLIRCLKNEDPKAVVNFLQKVYNVHTISDRILLLRGAISAGEDGSAILDIFRRYCTQEELAVLDRDSSMPEC